MEGVIEKIEVFPDQTVVAGDLLFSMDQRDLKNANELAKRELATAMAKYKTAIQSGFEDVKKRAEIKVLQAQISEKELEVDYTSHLLQEADVKAEVAGIIVLDNKNRWIGKPVSTGENIMQIADSNRVEIEISLPVDHAIFFHPGDKVKLFLNADPLNPILATIEYSSFEAAIVNSNILAYQIIASIDRNQSAPRIGSQGTAKIIGDNVSLFYYLFRKPISSFRQFTGW
jgi:multidrug resistance efflux pump